MNTNLSVFSTRDKKLASGTVICNLKNICNIQTVRLIYLNSNPRQHLDYSFIVFWNCQTHCYCFECVRATLSREPKKSVAELIETFDILLLYLIIEQL
jgi:hypothetical protein